MIGTNKVIAVCSGGLAILIVAGLLIRKHSLKEDPCAMYDFLSSTKNSVDGEESESGLFLTPLIRDGRIEEGQRLAFVSNWKGVDSYSGFLTVNQTSGSNLFFWLFPVSPTYVSILELHRDVD
jgi:myosin-crossreactive antigen